MVVALGWRYGEIIQYRRYLTSFQSFIDFDSKTFSGLRITFGTPFLKLCVTGMLWSQGPEEELSAKRRWLRKLLMRLIFEFDTLPGSMIVQVVNVSEYAIYSGGLTDVFTARCNGKAVALKRFRVSRQDITTKMIRVLLRDSYDSLRKSLITY